MRWELEGQMLQHFGEQKMVEFAGSINVRWITLGRVHHRSGIFGLFSHSGSNVLEIGVRYRF